MSAAADRKDAQIRIDRLVLDIPGFDPAQARELAANIARRLTAYSNLPAQRAIPSLVLEPAGNNPQEIADKIVAALMQRLL